MRSSMRSIMNRRARGGGWWVAGMRALCMEDGADLSAWSAWRLASGPHRSGLAEGRRVVAGRCGR